MARIALIVVFAWLIITERDGWAIAALAAAGVSDFLDGFLARRWNQVTALGKILDPAADRLLTIAVVLALAWRDIVPWWLVFVLLTRDAVVGIALLIGRSRGASAPQVTFIGKLATALLYVFLPLSYLAYDRWDPVHVLAIVGATVTSALYWAAGLRYVREILAPQPRGADA